MKRAAVALMIALACAGCRRTAAAPRASPPAHIPRARPGANALCQYCGLPFRTRLPPGERVRCLRCDAIIGVGRARALFRAGSVNHR